MRGAADQLQLEVILVATLTLAEVVKISGDAHVLAAQHLMLLPERRVLLFELLVLRSVGFFLADGSGRWLCVSRGA